MSGDQDACTSTFYQNVCVSGEVTVTPRMACGPAQVTCLGGRVSHKRPKPRTGPQFCRLTVFQELCVAVPISFDAHAVCRTDRVDCGPVSTQPCGD